VTFPALKIILKGDKFDSEYMHHTSVIHFVDMWSNTFVLRIEKLETPLIIHVAICRF
jgi:hypothetical protein